MSQPASELPTTAHPLANQDTDTVAAIADYEWIF